MRISEILIIYLAVGAPIGVFAIARSKDLLAKHLVAILAVNVILWPLYASREFVPRPSTGNGTKFWVGNRAAAAGVFESRSGFTSSIKETGDRIFRRQAFDDFERFTALSDAVPAEATSIDIGISEFFEISGHPKPSVASKCLFRQNRRKLIDHRDRALADLTALSGKLTFEEQAVYNSAIKTEEAELLDQAIS